LLEPELEAHQIDFALLILHVSHMKRIGAASFYLPLPEPDHFLHHINAAPQFTVKNFAIVLIPGMVFQAPPGWNLLMVLLTSTAIASLWYHPAQQQLEKQQQAQLQQQ
jgi:hypothetical protein